MSTFVTSRYALGLGAAAALLAGCGGSQPPFSLPPQATQQQLFGRGVYTILHRFGRSAGDGTHPEADLIDAKGTMYGTTVKGGAYGYGTVFAITTSGKETVLHSFGAPGDGGSPTARLLNVNGMLYGTTYYGGAHDGGTVFSITPNGTEKVLHSFDSSYQSGHPNHGSLPHGSLVNVNGTLYGTTEQGGTHMCNTYDFCGTVFSITLRGEYKVLHNFNRGPRDGANPQAALLNVNGTLYGTTAGGGLHTIGTIFSVTSTGEFKKIYDFGTTPNDGQEPMSGLIDVQGVLYGTTVLGGYGSGTVFGVTTDGTEKFLFGFALSGSNGSQPVAALKNVNGVLYGTTTMGGVSNLGTLFKLAKSGKETVLHSFAKGTGYNPVAGVIAVGSTLYGTTYGRQTGSPKHTLGNVYSFRP